MNKTIIRVVRKLFQTSYNNLTQTYKNESNSKPAIEKVLEDMLDQHFPNLLNQLEEFRVTKPNLETYLYLIVGQTKSKRKI